MAYSALDILIDLAIAEDIRDGDITSKAMGVSGECRGEIVAKENLVVCGQEIASLVFLKVDENLKYIPSSEDGTRVETGQRIGVVSGSLLSVLSAERIVLNFLQRLSAIATKTARIVEMIAGSNVRVLDTRKTTPGFRLLEKHAVKVGGGHNHRFGLYDAFLIKDNHVDLLNGDIAQAILKCKRADSSKKVEVEIRNTSELERAIEAQPDVLLLDNMTPESVKDAVEIIRQSPLWGKVEIEISGGITEENIGEYAKLDITSISLGALTHTVRAADISMRCLPCA